MKMMKSLSTAKLFQIYVLLIHIPIVDVVVCRALDVLDLLLTFQFNTRLESFIAKFKTAELSASTKKSKLRSSVLVPLLYDDFDPFDTSK